MTLRVKRVLVGVGIALMAVVAGEVVFRRVVDAEWLERKVADVVGPSWTVTIGSARATLLGAKLTASDVRLARSASANPDGLTIGAALVALDGVDVGAVLTRRGLKLRRLRIETPVIGLPATHAGLRQVGQPPASAAAQERQPRAWPRFRCGRIEITGAALRLPPPDADQGLRGIDIVATDADVSARSLAATDRLLFCRGIELRAPVNQWRRGPYAWTLGAVRFSTREGTIAVDSLRVAPWVSEKEFRRLQQYRADRYDFACGALSGELAELCLPPAATRVELSTARVADLRVSVFSDGTLPPRPDRPRSHMPHELLRRSGVTIGVDSLEIAGGRVRYSERSEAGGQSGMVEFTEFHATIRNLASDSTVSAGNQPATFEVATRLFDQAPLTVHIEYDLLGEALDVDAAGSLGSLPASAFNAVLAPLEGARFSAGTLDSLRFATHLGPQRADGQLGIRFRDLEVRPGDKKGQGTVDDLKILVMDAFKLRSKTGTGPDSLRTFPLAYDRQPHDGFFKYAWASVRSGLLGSLGL